MTMEIATGAAARKSGTESHTNQGVIARWIGWTTMTTSDPMTAEKCEPPPELRGVDGWHWVQWPSGREVPQFWGGSDDEGCQWHAGTPTLSMRYLSPALTPAEVAALRAERDAAVAAGQTYMSAAATARTDLWLMTEQRDGFRDGCDRLKAELTTLRAEVEKLREALEVVCQGVETFHINPVGGENIVVDGGDRFAHERDVKLLLAAARAATLANAVEVPE